MGRCTFIPWSSRIGASLVLLFLGLSGGCAAKQIEFQQPVYGLAFWRHISTHPVEPLADEYRIVADQPTEGMFPANLGVTRVDVEVLNERIGLERPVLRTDPRNEFLQWNAALDDLFAVSEVFPISEFDLGGGNAEPGQIIASFQALHARLGLVYAMNELSEDESEIIAVLYDNATARPIAFFQTSAVSIPPPDGDDKEPRDLWKTESEALVRAKFEHMVHSCIRTLILNDEPAEIETPTGWRPVDRKPAAWPPGWPRRGS